MRFLVDNQLPIALARFLAARGCDCDHVMDVGLGSATDSVIWHYAHQNELIVISKDEDFLYLATRPEGKAPYLGAPRQLPQSRVACHL